MAVYYNDSDPAACAWLRDLIAAGHLPAGEVDERSILDVEPSDETEEEYEPLSFGDKLFFAALMAFRFGLPLGLIVAFIVCAIYKRQLKSVRRATEAARYTVSGGAEITAREDRFTHTTEVRTPIKTESDDHDSGPSFSGGTTVNSGGFSHSGGKF